MEIGTFRVAKTGGLGENISIGSTLVSVYHVETGDVNNECVAIYVPYIVACNK